MQQIYSKPHPGTQINFAHPLARGLVGCWLMNEGGQQIYDLSPYKNHGKLYGFDSPPKRSSLGLQFDGVNDYVDAGNGASLNITGAITIGAWVNAASFVSSARIIDKPYTSVGEPYSQYNLRQGEDIDGTNRIGFEIAIGGVRKELNTLSTLSLNDWYHIVATYDGSYQRIWINGIEDNSRAQTGTITGYNTPVSVGAYKGGAGSAYFNGTINEVRIYNRALFPLEVRQLYTNPYDMFMT